MSSKFFSLCALTLSFGLLNAALAAETCYTVARTKVPTLPTETIFSYSKLSPVAFAKNGKMLFHNNQHLIAIDSNGKSETLFMLDPEEPTTVLQGKPQVFSDGTILLKAFASKGHYPTVNPRPYRMYFLDQTGGVKKTIDVTGNYIFTGPIEPKVTFEKAGVKREYVVNTRAGGFDLFDSAGNITTVSFEKGLDRGIDVRDVAPLPDGNYAVAAAEMVDEDAPNTIYLIDANGKVLDSRNGFFEPDSLVALANGGFGFLKTWEGFFTFNSSFALEKSYSVKNYAFMGVGHAKPLQFKDKTFVFGDDEGHLFFTGTNPKVVSVQKNGHVGIDQLLPLNLKTESFAAVDGTTVSFFDKQGRIFARANIPGDFFVNSLHAAVTASANGVIIQGWSESSNENQILSVTIDPTLVAKATQGTAMGCGNLHHK